MHIRPYSVLKEVVQRTYEGEEPEKENIPKLSPGETYSWNYFWPLYCDSLLLKRADVRKYCKENQIPQICEVKGLMWEEAPLLATPPAPPNEPASLPSAGQEMPLPPIKNRVSGMGTGSTQVNNTLKENPEAVAYARKRKEQGANPEDITAELKEAGGSLAVIGCILRPDYKSIKQAQQYGCYLLRKGRKG